MNKRLFHKVKELSKQNDLPKQQVRTDDAIIQDYMIMKRNKAKRKAALELVKFIYEDHMLVEHIENRARKGYYNYLLFAVSTDPSTNDLCTHEHNHPYFETNYESKIYTFTYQSLFWHPAWKKSFKPFKLIYSYNKERTLLSVYLDWRE